MMRKVFFGVVAVLMMCANGFAAEPIPIANLEFYLAGSNYYSTSSYSRTNLHLRYWDETATPIHQPERLVKVWFKFENNPLCGDMNTTATLTLHTGQTVVMKKNVDYNFMLPVMQQDIPIEFNKRINVGDIVETCIRAEAFDNTANGIPTNYHQ